MVCSFKRNRLDYLQCFIFFSKVYIIRIKIMHNNLDYKTEYKVFLKLTLPNSTLLISLPYYY